MCLSRYDARLDELPYSRLSRKEHETIDLGGFAVAASHRQSLPCPLDEYLQHTPHLGLVSLPGDLPLNQHGPLVALNNQRRGHTTGQTLGTGALLSGKGEHAYLVEGNVSHKVKHGGELILGLAWVAHNERRTQANVGHGLTQPFDKVVDAVYVVGPPHSLEYVGMAVL